MALTVTQALTRVRDYLDEATESRWTNAQLRRWMNDCLDDMSRRTLAIRDTVTLASVAAQAEYTVTGSVLEITACYWTDGSGNLCPLSPVQWENADSVWGMWQNQQSLNPAVYTTWGYAPSLKLRLYPVPNVSSRNIVLKVARIATHLDETGAGDAAAIDFPEAWAPTIVRYTEAMALRKDRDPRWQDALSLYDAEVTTLARHDYMNVAKEMVYDPATAGGWLPRWLTHP